MASNEITYYLSRAQAERELAKSSSDPAVAAIHEKMADLYDRLIEIDAQKKEGAVLPFNQAKRA